MAGMDLVYLLVAGGAVFLAYSTGLLDQAGQALVNATGKQQQQQGQGQGQGQGYAKHRVKIIKGRRVLVPEIIEPVILQPRMRLTIV